MFLKKKITYPYFITKVTKRNKMPFGNRSAIVETRKMESLVDKECRFIKNDNIKRFSK